MYVVTGVSGNTGSAVASSLIKRGQKVRVLVHNSEKGHRWAEKGAEVVTGSFEDSEGMRRLLEGAKGAYFLVPPNMATRDPLGWYQKIAECFRNALALKPLPHAVALSALGADRPQPFDQLHEMERILTNLSTPITFLRASYFMENLQQSMPAMKSQGVLPCFMDTRRKIPMVSCRDVGELAAELLIQATTAKPVVEITGPDDYSFDDAAMAYSLVLNKRIEAIRIPDDQIIPTAIQNGATPELASFFKRMFDAVGRGEVMPSGGQEIPLRRGHIRLEDEVRQLVAAGSSAYVH